MLPFLFGGPPSFPKTGYAMPAPEPAAPEEELEAFEFICTTIGPGRHRISSFLAEHGNLPSEALPSAEGSFSDEARMAEIRSILAARRGLFSFSTLGMPGFPSCIMHQKEPLPILYHKGSLSLLSERCICVAGTRQPDLLDISAAWRIGHALAAHGYTVASGLAAGVDTASAVAAIDEGGRVVGVIGTPIDLVFPQENAHLFGEVSSQGLLMSQVPLCLYSHQISDARKTYFLDRNDLLATISEAVVIVQAGERGGSAATARAAVSHGKRLLLLPDVAENTSWGRYYVSEGKATVARNVTQIIESLDAMTSERSEEMGTYEIAPLHK